MARVTVEDCVDKLPNRFELVMTAAQRARQLGSGSALTVDRDNDKNPVVSLREIAGETVSIPHLQEELVRGYQKVVPLDEEEDDTIDLMDGEKELIGATGMYADELPDVDENDEDAEELPGDLSVEAGDDTEND